MFTYVIWKCIKFLRIIVLPTLYIKCPRLKKKFRRKSRRTFKAHKNSFSPLFRIFILFHFIYFVFVFLPNNLNIFSTSKFSWSTQLCVSVCIIHDEIEYGGMEGIINMWLYISKRNGIRRLLIFQWIFRSFLFFLGFMMENVFAKSKVQIKFCFFSVFRKIYCLFLFIL